ncbi:hypothetical protein Pr1d_51910 [Bythopirellula goksoeyrii]|uniref:Uncharacterized protein n=1 Tax=Bythopirellula goksoeyrii TaxID=1400387 RepID=A0A5B9QV87_9BACT|nr:hypothetical protein Pr1d_51910 [Bythopirellula goksoeyrii]
MKSFVRILDAEEVQKEYPIADRVPGWFFRLREVANCAWIAEGTDLWGRQVSDSGHDEEQLLESCCAAAYRINEQIQKSIR